MAVADLNTFQAMIRSVIEGSHVYQAVWLPICRYADQLEN